MKVYLDISEISNKTGAISYVFPANIEIIPTGTTISAMSIQDNNKDYRLYAEKHDLQFIFEDNIPAIDFYAVPQLDIFALDNKGGMLATLGAATDINELTKPICYISNNRDCFTIADNLNQFMQMIATQKEWRLNMKNTKNISIYSSKSEAEQKVNFFKFQNTNAK